MDHSTVNRLSIVSALRLNVARAEIDVAAKWARDIVEE